jgi:hypothetical protein
MCRKMLLRQFSRMRKPPSKRMSAMPLRFQAGAMTSLIDLGDEEMRAGRRRDTERLTAETAAVKAPKKKGKMSAAGRAAIRAAQKARWAKIKGTAKPAKKAKRKMSAAGRAAISAAAKARWAKAKAAGKSRL